jgi:hypothetical protein
MNKTIKKEFLPGGARRQELLDQVPDYLKTPGLQANKHMFCIDILKMTETEYLEALNKATNGGVVEAAWN